MDENFEPESQELLRGSSKCAEIVLFESASNFLFIIFISITFSLVPSIDKVRNFHFEVKRDYNFDFFFNPYQLTIIALQNFKEPNCTIWRRDLNYNSCSFPFFSALCDFFSEMSIKIPALFFFHILEQNGCKTFPKGDIPLSPRQFGPLLGFWELWKSTRHFEVFSLFLSLR